jgi:DNA repair exonuclease SbcCD ATPase subunit
MSFIPLKEHVKRLGQLQVEYMGAVTSLKTNRKVYVKAKARVGHAKQAQEILQTVAASVQQMTHDRVARIVTRCLAAVFDEPYTFQIKFERKRGKTEARLVFERKGREMDPMEASGGGVVDVATFALRLAAILITQPPLERFMALDEPFKFVSKEYRPKVVELMETLSKELSFQFLIVTHDEELKIGKVIKIK